MADQAVAPELVRLGTRPRLVPYLRSIWERRELAIALPVGELRSQNVDTLLGSFWHVLNPLMLVGVYYLLFAVILGVDRGQENFILFLSVGMFTFHYTSKSVMAGARSIVSNQGLIRSVMFPRAILPLGSVIGETVTLGPSLVVITTVAVATGAYPSWSWLWLLPIFALQGTFNLGASLVIARLANHFHDITNVLQYFFRLLLYASGVLVPVERFLTSPLRRAVFRYNPAYAFVELARGAIMRGGTDPGLWAVCAGWTLVLLVGGFLFFVAHEHRYGRG